MKNFAVIGQDGRQQAAGEYLKSRGYGVYRAEGVHLADYILLPMPLSADTVSQVQLLHAAAKGALAFGGKISPEARAVAQSAGVELLDYLDREELAQHNAIPTVEGAIEILLSQRKRTLWNTKALVVGYGRIARLLCQRLAAFGAHVTVAARKPGARAAAEAMGYAAQPLAVLREAAEDAEVLINTVPAPVITAFVLQKLPKGAFVLDLASVPGGVDQTAAKRLELDTVWALSLPAKCAPVTAGEFVARTVLEMIAERGTQEDED